MGQLIRVLRSLVFQIGFVTATVIYGLLCLLVLPLLTGRSRFAFAIGLNRFVLLWFRITCGVKYEIIGREHLLEHETGVLVCNHQSAWETFYLQILVFPLSTVLKKELLRIPVFGWALALIRPIAIDRSLGASALKQVVRQGKERIQEGFWVLIFPEGTRLNYGERKKFSKTGAFLAVESGAPIIPIVHNAGACWPARGFVKHGGTIRVEIGPPMDTRDQSVQAVYDYTSSWMEERLAQQQ